MVQDEANLKLWKDANVEVEAERRIVLRNIRWETYRAILSDHENASAPRFTYDRGELEIMSPMMLHEVADRSLSRLVDFVLVEREVDFLNLGSTTFAREEYQRGFDPDTCFYVQRAPGIRGLRGVNPQRYPPPDLVIDIAFMAPLVNKLEVFGTLGVGEVWRYDGHKLDVYVPDRAGYELSEQSRVIPGIAAADLTIQMQDVFDIGQLEWTRRIRAWTETLATS